MNCVWPITCPTPYGHAGMYPCKNNKKYPDKNFVNNFFLLSGIKKKGKKKRRTEYTLQLLRYNNKPNKGTQN